MALKNLNLLNKNDAIDCLKKYKKSLKETINGYHELEKYLNKHHAHMANLQLATRRVYMLKGEKKWVNTFIEEYSKE